MKLEVVKIPDGDLELAALRYLPEKTPRPTALLYAHGFTSGKYSLDGLASYLAGRGYEGLTFDFVGHKLGGTGGEMRRISQAADNLRAAQDWLRAHSEATQIVLIGHSMGAAAVLAVAAEACRNSGRVSGIEGRVSGKVTAEEGQNPGPEEGARLAGIVCLCLGTSPTRGFESTIGQTMLAQRSDYVAGAPARELLDGLDALVSGVPVLEGLPALFIAARQDVLVSVKRVEALAALAGSQASVAVVESSHLEAPDRSRGVIVQWLEDRATS